MEKMLIKGVAKDNEVARISIIGLPDEPGIAFRLFSKLAGKKVNVDIILQSVGRDGTKDIAFTVPQNQGKSVVELLSNDAAFLGDAVIQYDENVSKVSIVGAGMETHPGVAATMFEALYEANINIQMISTSEIKVSVLINEDDADTAVSAIHKAFFHEN